MTIYLKKDNSLRALSSIQEITKEFTVSISPAPASINLNIPSLQVAFMNADDSEWVIPGLKLRNIQHDPNGYAFVDTAHSAREIGEGLTFALADYNLDQEEMNSVANLIAPIHPHRG